MTERSHGKLRIRPDGALDFLSLGALVHRLDPGIVPFRKASHCDIHVSGGEFNVAANLSDCFGMKAGIASAMVDYPIGELIGERVRAMGVRPFYKRFPHNGVNGPNMATVYSDRGAGMRAPVVFYNRANEAAAELKPGDFDWAAIFGGGRPLVPQRRDLRGAVQDDGRPHRRGDEGRQGGRRRHQLRSQLPREALEPVGRAKSRRRGRGARSWRTSTCWSATRRICRRGWGSPARRWRPGPSSIPSAFVGMIDKVVAKHPHVKAVATTLREVHSTNRHSWSAVAWLDGKIHQAPTAELDVVDRVGGGDGFAAGFIYGLLSGATPEEAVSLGWAHGALLTSFPGDTTMATLDQVRAFAKGGSARIQR